MGFVIVMKFLHYPERIFTLFQKVSHIIQIACHRSVFTVSANLFNESEIGQAFYCSVNSLPVYAAFFRNHSPRGKTRTVFVVAVPKQTTVNGKVPRLQIQIKYSIRNHKEILVWHSILLSKIYVGLAKIQDSILLQTTKKDPHIHRTVTQTSERNWFALKCSVPMYVRVLKLKKINR